jgi:hypothetical protein
MTKPRAGLSRMSGLVSRLFAFAGPLVAWARRFRHTPVVLALMPALWVSWPILVEKPLSGDHATHLFKAWHLWSEMIPSGRLRGWSHFWGFGFPSDELVPFGSEVWVSLFHAVTFAQLDWLTTYALSFAGLMVFKTLAAFWFARRFFGSTVGVICAWITVLDPGAFLEGGWNWHSYWGVWPVTLAVSLVQLSLLRLDRVLARGRARDVALAGGWFGAALLTHQMALVAVVVSAPLLLVDHHFRRHGVRSRHVAHALGALLFGLGLSAFFFVPFFSRTGDTQDLGWLGYSLADASQRFVSFRTFQAVWMPIQGLGVAGIWFALRSRRPGRLFFVSAAGILVFLGTGVLINQFHLERVLPTLVKLEVNRMLLVAKLFWFPLAAYALVVLMRGNEYGRRGKAGVKQRTLRWTIGVALAAALLVPGYQHFYDTQIKKEIEGESTHKYWADIQDYLRWSRREQAASKEHYRIAYHMSRGNHISTLAPVFDNTPIYKVGYTPSQIFNKFPMTDEAPLFKALGVKYVMSSYPVQRPDLELERRFGELYVYRHKNYDPNPFTVTGGGLGKLLEFSSERIAIQLRGTSRASRVKVHVANYARWQATIDGRRVPISTVPVYGAEYPILMEIPARDGELVIEYVYLPADWLGLLLTLAALPVFFGVWWLGRKSSTLDRWFALADRRRRAIAWGAFGLVALAAATFLLVAQLRTAPLRPESLFYRLERPEFRMGAHHCKKTGPLAFACGPHVVEASVVSGVWGVHLCMSSNEAPKVGPLSIRSRVRLGSFLRGQYDPSKEGRGTIQVNVDGRPLGRVATRPSFLRHQFIQFDTRELKGQSVNLELLLSGAALHCFDFDIAP